MELDLLLLQPVIVQELEDSLEPSVTSHQLINATTQLVENMEFVTHLLLEQLDLLNVFVQMDGLEITVINNHSTALINVKMEENVMLLDL